MKQIGSANNADARPGNYCSYRAATRLVGLSA